jgi:ABC-type Fe3+ transport system permease subunit
VARFSRIFILPVFFPAARVIDPRLDSPAGAGLRDLEARLEKFFHATSGPFDIFSFWGIVWTHLATYGISLKVMLLTPAFLNMNASFEEASRICGASGLRTLSRIIVPIMTPAIVIVFLLSTIRGLQTFEIEMILGAPVGLFVYSTKIYTLLFQEPQGIAPACFNWISWSAANMKMPPWSLLLLSYSARGEYCWREH